MSESDAVGVNKTASLSSTDDLKLYWQAKPYPPHPKPALHLKQEVQKRKEVAKRKTSFFSIKLTSEARPKRSLEKEKDGC